MVLTKGVGERRSLATEWTRLAQPHRTGDDDKGEDSPHISGGMCLHPSVLSILGYYTQLVGGLDS